MKRYLIAVDGGQTHSLAIVADESGTVMGAGTGGPANHYLEPGGKERFRNSMRNCIEGAFAQAGLSPQPVSASYYALTGVHADMPAALQQIAQAEHQMVAGDKDASLIGGTLERPAVLVLAGTGAIACAVDRDGREAHTGGWGYLMGDEGSASWIAPRALSAATQAEDGRGPATLLTTLIPHHFGTQNLRTLHPLIYNQRIDRVRLASAASVVGEAAQAGDQVAQSILAEAGSYLGTAGVRVIRELNLSQAPIVVTTAGGVFKAGAIIIQPMMARIHTDCPRARYQPPSFPPVIGALFLALQSLSLAVTPQVVANVCATQPIWDHRK
jgi:N-acetylglucosamine kinase-like BadF-type ATPase